MAIDTRTPGSSGTPSGVPAGRSSAAATPAPLHPHPQPEAEAPGSHPPALRILVAEDNIDLQQIFARQLTLLGLEVLAVTNGRDAVELTLAAQRVGHGFDLVLMDLEMPIVDGYEAIRQLRAGGFSGPILALSAHSSDDNRMDCIALGCNDCLSKPIEWNHLVTLVGRYLPGLGASGPSLLPDP